MDPTQKSWSVYYALPGSVQNLALSFEGIRRRNIRYGPDFRHKYGFLLSTDNWERVHIETHQDDEITDLVDRAYRETEYYRSVMDERGLKPRDIQGRADLHKLPILTKDDIRKNFDDLVSARAQPEELIEIQTSGSSGAPLTVLTTREALGFKWAVWWRHRAWFGMQRGDLHLNVSTKPLVSPNRKRPPFWRWNRYERNAILPMQQVVPSKVAAIVAFLEETPFEFYSGYPSILHSLAAIASERGLGLDTGPRVVFTGAEGIDEQQRIDIEAFAGAPVAEMYGFNEGAGNASSCPEGNLHEDFEFGYLECSDPVVDEETGVTGGRLLATGFSTGAFPLIRYDVGDYGRWMPDGFRCPCGRESRVLHSIDGRSEDYVVTPSGQTVRRLGDVFKEMPNLKQFQIVQEDPQRITLRLVARDDYSDADEERLRRRVALWIDDSIDVAFEYVDHIPPAPNGKYQRVVNRLRR